MHQQPFCMHVFVRVHVRPWMHTCQCVSTDAAVTVEAAGRGRNRDINVSEVDLI